MSWEVVVVCMFTCNSLQTSNSRLFLYIDIGVCMFVFYINTILFYECVLMFINLSSSIVQSRSIFIAREMLI